MKLTVAPCKACGIQILRHRAQSEILLSLRFLVEVSNDKSLSWTYGTLFRNCQGS